MSDLSSIVATAVSEAKGESTDAAIGSGTETSTEGEVQSSDDAAESASAVVPDTPPDAPTAATGTETTQDDLAVELEGLGIKAPIAGKPENRIPYSRVKKMTEGLRTKLTTAHKAELDAREAKIAAAEARHAQLIQQALNDPETNLRQLIEANPVYREVIKKVMQGETPAAPTIPAGDPMPEPDAGPFPDGTKGYTPDGLTRLLEWNARRAEERAYARYQQDADKRFGPIAKEWQAQKAFEAQVPALRERIDRVHRTWGADLVNKHEKEITALLAKQPDPTARGVFEQVVTEVLLPKVVADRNTMREDLVKEIKAAPAAAARVTPSATTAAADAGPRSLEQTIKDSLAGLPGR